jgi:hypothetical protein
MYLAWLQRKNKGSTWWILKTSRIFVLGDSRVLAWCNPKPASHYETHVAVINAGYAYMDTGKLLQKNSTRWKR